MFIIIIKVQCHAVERLILRGGRSKQDLFFFRLISAENSVPDHDQGAIILVNTIWILAMMYAMLSGSVDNILDRSEMADHFCVKPNLIDQRELHMNQQNRWRHYQRQRCRKE